MDPEIECVHPSTGKADGLGELVGGMLFDISLGMARRLMMANTRDHGGVILLDELGEKGARFEIAVGRNGKVWVNSDSIRATTAIGKALQEIDSEGQCVAAQEKTVKKVLRCFFD